MKTKPIKLLLLIIFLGSFAIVLVTTGRFTEQSGTGLPLQRVWTFKAGNPIVATPIQIGDQIIFRTVNKIYSIDSVDGSMNWEIAARASNITANVNLIKKPIVGNSNFLVSEEENNSISVYSTKTGGKIWGVSGQVNSINGIEIVGDVMIVATHDADLVVYDLTSRQKLWGVALPARTGTPVGIGADFIVLGARNALRVYSLKEGRLLNEKTYDMSSIGEIELSKSSIFITYAKNGDWSISSLQWDSLDENWTFHGGEITHPYLFGTNDSLVIFNKALTLLDINSGKVLWQDNAQEYYSPPAFHENSVFFVSMQGLFDKRVCRVQLKKSPVKACSSLENNGMSLNPMRSLLGPLTTDELLIIAHDSEIFAFKIP